MKFSPPLLQARFGKRYKRFFTDVVTPDGITLTVHCPNTGSMKNCYREGAPCWYSLSDNPKRKLPGTLEITTSPLGSRTGVNTHRANPLVEEAIQCGVIAELQGYDEIRREVRYGNENSRIDLLLSGPDKACYIEVKNVTMEMSRQQMQFPDAVTSRGTKHLRELVDVIRQGHRAVLLFCVQHERATRVAPAWDIDPHYCETLQTAINEGLEVLAYACKVTPREIVINRSITFNLQPE